MNDGALCRDCGKPLARGETRVLGSGYCDACVTARTFYCHTCRASLTAEDFAEGRAVTLLGRRFCENCLECAVRKGREEAGTGSDLNVSSSPVAMSDAPGVDTVTIRRTYGRFMPDHETVLSARADGLGGLLRGNRVRLWLDVSEGGFRAILAGSYEVDVPLSGRVDYRPAKESFPFKATVQHVRPAPRYPGCVLAGCRFENPSRELQAFILGKMSGRLAMIPAPKASKPTRDPTSTSIPPVRPARA